MNKVTNAADATHHASITRTVVPNTVKPLPNADGNIIAWTFATPRTGGGNGLDYGWVLPDGRVSPAVEWTRHDAEEYARNTVESPW